VEEADADGGDEALATGLDGVEVLDYFEEVLGRLEESPAGYLDAETAGAGEGFDDSPGCHAAEKGVE
jgi:hypothetical protein